MKLEKFCSAVVYTMKYGDDNPMFLVERDNKGSYFVPRVDLYVKEKEKEKDRVVISGMTSLAVSVDTVFRHDCWRNSIVYMAQVDPEEKVEWDTEDIHLNWIDWVGNFEYVRDESDRELLKHAAAYLAVKRGLKNPVKEFGFVWYREHAVDIHGHFIWDVDDGSRNETETMDLLRLGREEGMQWMFATPHYGIENGYDPDRRDVSGKFRKLSEYLFLSGSPMKVALGTEWYCSDEIVERIRNQEAFPMGNSDWYMVEFLEWGDVTEDAETMLRRLKKMKDNGIKTILAHPERYRAIQKDWNLAKRICDLNVLLQVNAYDLFLNPKDATRNLAQWMAKEELISFIGSDMHGTGIKPSGKPARRPQMKEGVSWLYENVDYEYANDIVRVNAERYLKVEKLL